MALSLYELQLLRKVRLDTLYDRNQDYWDHMITKAHVFAELNLLLEDSSYNVHIEDVAKFLMPVLETNRALDRFLGINKLREKYWIRYFCAYILDHYWDKLQNGQIKHAPPVIPNEPQPVIGPI